MNRFGFERDARGVMRAVTLCVPTGLILITLILVWKALPILQSHSIVELLLGSSWDPSDSVFGFFPYIIGTIVVTVLAIFITVPISLLSALYLSDYSSHKARGIIKPLIDLLAGIPSVVYGLWGTNLIVPLIRNQIAPAFSVTTTGYTVLAGGLVLSLMVFPITISIMEEVFTAIPRSMRESSLVLGATRWETAKFVVLKRGYPGVFAAIILGFSRAFGETIAVLMVIGNVAKVPISLFSPAYPLPALIANNYGEMMSIPLYDSALMLAALILLFVVGGFSILARIIQRRIYLRYK